MSALAQAERVQAPFGRRAAEVIAVERVGAYTLVRAFDRAGPDPRPGQFYMLAAAARWGGEEGGRPYLPRAFSYARSRARDGGVELEFLAEAVGPGTRRLCELETGEELLLTGPLGNGFSLPRDRRRPVLCGGGIGVAPLVCLAEALGQRTVLVGFRSGEHAVAARLFEEEPRVATDDGSVGHAGLVTELLRDELDGGGPAEVFACGPPAMLEGVRALCEELATPAQLALETGMACGYGACFGCVVPTEDGYVRLCIDGPILDAGALETALIPGSGH